MGETLDKGETLAGTLATLGLAGRDTLVSVGLVGGGTLFVEGKWYNDQGPSLGNKDRFGYSSGNKGLADSTLGQVRESGGVSMVAGHHI